ncbi:hypothetical protein KP509_01G088000 [Ceratopteris richardii]|uniref:Uncharacterized protein n=1 Tax=Ceratopteris richardii TaxID=49495 RepID=A0A8T2VEY9_CERRI|nr:hypothetical protein KP509_01G088000 [Ceratopteris richardii]
MSHWNFSLYCVSLFVNRDTKVLALEEATCIAPYGLSPTPEACYRVGQRCYIEARGFHQHYLRESAMHHHFMC